MKFIQFLIEQDKPNKSVQKAKAVWNQISNLLVDLKDELYDLKKTDEAAKRALEHLNNSNLSGLQSELRKLKH